MENSDRILVDFLSRRIANRNFPVTIKNRTLNWLNVNVPEDVQFNQVRNDKRGCYAGDPLYIIHNRYKLDQFESRQVHTLVKIVQPF